MSDNLPNAASAEHLLNNNFPGLQLAIELSSQPNRTALTRSFIAILEKRYQPHAIALYRPVFGQTIEAKRNVDLADVQVFDYLASEAPQALPLHSIQGAYTCASNDQPVESIDESHTVSFFPIHGFGAVSDILALSHNKATLLNQPEFQALLLLFENLLNIFNLAERDSLTNLLNRKAFDKTIVQIHNKEHQKHIKRSKQQFMYLALIDIDHFKRINDQFGHLYGDEILIGFARLLEQSFRRQDWIFRYGGEEFAVIVEDVSPGHIELVLNRFREKVESHRFPLVGQITVSIGCVHIKGGAASPYTIDNADKALYFSKDHGRNRVSVYDTLVHKGELPERATVDADVTLFQP